MPIVYKITNTINGKSYIGQTVRTLDQRWASHISAARQGSKFRFHSAIRKYGIDSWNLEVLFEDNDVSAIKAKEKALIAEYDLTRLGYNAKPGGCGGWIVPLENYDDWKNKQSKANSGARNNNYSGYTNDELIEIGKDICMKHKRVIGHKTMVDECKLLNINFPKSFSKMRFNGDYKEYAAILETELNMKYEPHFRTAEHRKKLSDANLGKISPLKNGKFVMTNGKKKYVKD